MTKWNNVLSRHATCVGRNIWVSDRHGCDALSALELPTLHIFRLDRPDAMCELVHSLNWRRPQDLLLNYKQGDLIGDGLVLSGISVEQLLDFFRGGGAPTIVHCASGQRRAPTLAVCGLMARGAPAETAVGQVVERLFMARGIAPHLSWQPLTEILEFFAGSSW